jgi:hypothetical protein
VKLANLGFPAQIALVPAGSGGDVLVRDEQRYEWWRAGTAMLWDLSQGVRWSTTGTTPPAGNPVALGVAAIVVVGMAYPACTWHASSVTGEVNIARAHIAARSKEDTYAFCMQQRARDRSVECPMPNFSDVAAPQRDPVNNAMDKMTELGGQMLIVLGVGAAAVMGASWIVPRVLDRVLPSPSGAR